MQYVGTVIRPPSEANSIILQVTVGCSHNKCTFCGAYKDLRFTVKDYDTILQDIYFAADYCQRQNRLFLADGDAMILPYTLLARIMEDIHRHLPWVNRVSMYANARSIRAKSDTELRHLKSSGVDRIYLGVESGDDATLKAIKKEETSQSIKEACERIIEHGFFLSTTIILGITGKKRSQIHAEKSAALLNEISPHQIGALTYMPLANTSLGKEVANGSFQLLSAREILAELKTIIRNLSCKKTQFMANHASNYLPITGRLPKDKMKFIDLISQAEQGLVGLKSDLLRAL